VTLRPLIRPLVVVMPELLPGGAFGQAAPAPAFEAASRAA
jgi:hypothetical protein